MRQIAFSIAVFIVMLISNCATSYCQSNFDKPIPEDWNYLFESFRVVRGLNIESSHISRKGILTETISSNDGRVLRFLKYNKNGSVIIDKQSNLDTTYYSYNQLGDMEYMTTESNSYDSIFNRYDKMNRLIAQYSKKYNSEMWFEYTNHGMTRRIKFHKGTSDSIDSPNQLIRTIEFSYTDEGYLKTAKRNYSWNNYEIFDFQYNGDTIICLNSRANKGKGATDAIKCIYNANLLIERKTSINSNNSVVTESYSYDSEGKIIKKIESSTVGNLKESSFEYNDSGLPIKRINEVVKSVIYEPRKTVFIHKYTYYQK